MTDPVDNPVRRDQPTPLTTPVRIEDSTLDRAVSTFPLDSAELLLTGHYPGFPIFPGVCLVECAHRTALAALADHKPAGSVRMAAIESARFLGPVFPGDTVHTEATAEAVDGGWRCRARLAAERSDGGPRREVAVVRLRYRTGAA